MTTWSWPEGFAARGPQPDDAAAVTALIAACELHANGEVDVSEDDVTSDWNQPSFDLAQDAVLVEGAGGIAAYAEHLRGRAMAWVHPELRGRGLGTALLQWTEERARATGEDTVGQTLSENETDARELLSRGGYDVRWDSWVFQRPLDEHGRNAVPPPGITIRPLRRPDDEAAVHELIEAAFSHWPGRAAVPFQDWVAAHLDRDDSDDGLRLLAVDEAGDVVGVALCLIYEDEGWVAELAVTEAQRGRGIGQALLAAAFAEFRRRGLRTAGLNTDSRTGARALYERVGMRVVRSYARFGKTL